MSNDSQIETDYCKGTHEGLSEYFMATASWRHRRARDFPNHLGNLEAAELLEGLAASVPTDNDLARQACELFGSDDYSNDGLLDACLEGVGFLFRPRDADEFLRLLVASHAGWKAGA